MKNDVYAALKDGFTSPIRDPLWGHIYLTPELEAVTKSPCFMRLCRIFQLGPVYCVYPGATHTRAGHSIGVYHLAHRLIRNLAEQGAGEWLSVTGVRSFLAAALLHDMGHFPYTHSLKELLLLSHEELTGKIIVSDAMKNLVASSGADPYFTAAIVDAGLPANGSQELLFYRKLLSGALDPDKLDYLNRDARYAGVPYGTQDVDFIFSRLHPHIERGVDIDSRGIPSVESILFSKYLMYKTVYWHHSVRSATAMIKKALIAGLEKGILVNEELYNLDDQGLFNLLAGRSPKLAVLSLAENVRDGCLYETAAEFPYSEPDHNGLLDLSRRSEYEKTLAENLSASLNKHILPEEIIIDVTEPISLETGLFVKDENCAFAESSSIFKGETVAAFRRALQTVRVFVHPKHNIAAKHVQNFIDTLHFNKK
jgi:HD superfamily phosphohydrolase